MANTKVSALGSVTPVGTDLLYVVDDPGGTPASAKATISAVMALAPVQSVAGETGAITASALRTAINVADGAEANAVDSVNSQTGVVVLDADDIDDTSTTNKFTTAAEASKLAGIEAGADVTDAANVAAAGAVMDGDFSVNGLMERTGAGAYSITTVTAYAKTLLDDADAAAARTTLGLGTAATAATGDFATAAQGALADSAVQPADLAAVATTGAYADLSGAPTIPDETNDLAVSGDSSSGGSVTVGATLRNGVLRRTVTGNATFTFTAPATTYASFVLHLINGGDHTVTWPASVDWPGGSAPALTASGADVLTFVTTNGGTDWLGFLSGADLS